MIHQIGAFGVDQNGFQIEDISWKPPGTIVADGAKVAPASRMSYPFGALN